MPAKSGFDYAPLTYNYRIYRIDTTSPNFHFLVGKYSALSLLALTTDPGSFGLAYMTEAAFTPADWIKRLSRPNVHIFVCVAHPSVLSVEDLTIENGSWIGMVTQVGSSKKLYQLPESGADEPLDDELETHWHQTGTWIHPAHRGHGLAKQIIAAGVSFAASTINGTVKQARLRAITGPYNNISMDLYGRLGFSKVGKCTPNEAMKANGNQDFPFLGRKDWAEELMNERGGVVLERVVTKNIAE